MNSQRYKYTRRNIFIWAGISLNAVVFIIFMILAANHHLVTYLVRQLGGQLEVIINAVPMDDYIQRVTTGANEKENIRLINSVKKYSVDSLGFIPTDNFTTVYNDNEPVLWVVTASEPFAIEPFKWKFPFIGEVSYKGFFDRRKAQQEHKRLGDMGYDVETESVSAWSTLGWFNDPVMTSTLRRGKGHLCNLLFHELFHATYYEKGNTEFNENIASFIAHEATRLFLSEDTVSLSQYLYDHSDRIIFNNYILSSMDFLSDYYRQIRNRPDRQELKHRAITAIADNIKFLELHNLSRYTSRKEQMLKSGNAWFIGYQQYDRMQDSLQKVFNKIYRRDLKKLVKDLRLRRFNS